MNNIITSLAFLFMICHIQCRQGTISQAKSATISSYTLENACSNRQDSLDTFGATVFLFDDESFQIPDSVHEMQGTTCPRLVHAEQQLKATIKSCLKPFPQTLAGFLTRGARQTRKLMCESHESRVAFVQHMSCMRDPNRIKRLRDIMDRYASKLMTIHHSVPMEMKFDSVYCSYHQVRRELASASKSCCSQASVTYLVNVMDGVYNQALKLASSFKRYRRGSRIKCSKDLSHPVPVGMTTTVQQKTRSSFLPLFLVLEDLSEEEE